MKKQINEGLADRLRSALSVLRSRHDEAQEPHFADPVAKAEVPPTVAPPNTSLSDTENAEGDMVRASTMHSVYTSHLAAGRDFHEMLARHAADLKDLVDRHGNALNPLDKHVTNLSRAHLRASREANKVTSNAKEEAALAGMTALRGAGFNVLQGLKHNKTKPIKPAIKPKYDSVETVRNPSGLTKK